MSCEVLLRSARGRGCALHHGNICVEGTHYTIYSEKYPLITTWSFFFNPREKRFLINKSLKQIHSNLSPWVSWNMLN